MRGEVRETVYVINRVKKEKAEGEQKVEKDVHVRTDAGRRAVPVGREDLDDGREDARDAVERRRKRVACAAVRRREDFRRVGVQHAVHLMFWIWVSCQSRRRE